VFWESNPTNIKSPVFRGNIAITLITQKTLRAPILPRIDFQVLYGIELIVSHIGLDLWMSKMDPIIEEAIRDSLEKPEGKLTKGDYNKVHELRISGEELKDVSSLAGLSGLKQLDLSYNELGIHRKVLGESGDQLKHLEKLRKLEVLDLSENHLIDVSALASLKNLTYLGLSYNKITDISTLGSFSKLVTLALDSNGLTSLDGLSKLDKLETLTLDYNEIKDMSVLAGLKHLKDLRLRHNGFTDLSFLEGLTNLEELALGGNQLTDLSVLAGLKKLKYIDIQDNQIIDLNALAGLKKLRFLQFGDNRLIQGNIHKELPRSQITKLKKALPKCVMKP